MVSNSVPFRAVCTLGRCEKLLYSGQKGGTSQELRLVFEHLEVCTKCSQLQFERHRARGTKDLAESDDSSARLTLASLFRVRTVFSADLMSHSVC
jgi:hypothetical protein